MLSEFSGSKSQVILQISHWNERNILGSRWKLISLFIPEFSDPAEPSSNPTGSSDPPLLLPPWLHPPHHHHHQRNQNPLHPDEIKKERRETFEIYRIRCKNKSTEFIQFDGMIIHKGQSHLLITFFILSLFLLFMFSLFLFHLLISHHNAAFILILVGV